MAPGLQHLKSALRRGLAPHARRLHLTGPYRGNVDGFTGKELNGWVVKNGSDKGGLKVGLFVDAGLLTSQPADLYRGDVAAAGIGDGHSGFAFTIDRAVRAAAEAGSGRVYVRVLDGSQHEIGRYDLSGAAADSLEGMGPQIERCRKLLYGGLDTLAQILATAPAAPDRDDRAPLECHRLFFTEDRLLPPGIGPAPAPGIAPLPAYLDYARFHRRKDREFDTEGNPEDRDHFLNWYLTVYGKDLGGLRVPLSRGLIDYLNAPVVTGGQRFSPGRFMWWRMAASGRMLDGLDLSSEAYFYRSLCWWAWEEAPALHVEDCLVTPRQADILRAVPAGHRDEAFPLSVFQSYFHDSNPEYRFLSAGRAGDRMLLTLSLMAMAARRPDVLRYLPERSVARLLDRSGGQPSIFESFVQGLLPEAGIGAVDFDRFAAALRMQGYDLYSQSFLTFTPDGHRLEAAALPRVTGEPVELQLIGPFQKASGLGQATRLSAAILEKTGIGVNCVSFGLDNPAPEGFSKVGKLADYRPAKVNLIHLNAETIPLVFAFEPDVFSGAYNIGYFYWEIDSPALCHYLGMGLLDEIWVSSEYGVSIYAPDAGKPVTNVGMAFEDLGEIDRAAARRFVAERFRLSDEFVFLVTFDSYSFVQRKNPIGVLEAFRRAFPGGEKVRLIIKTQNRDNVSDSVQDQMWKRVEAICARDPRIVVMNETLTYEALLRLKAGSDCYISLHKSEGWGFGMIEAMNLKVPVVCTAYSGNMDFCSDETAWLVRYQEVPLGPDDYIFVRKGQKWAEPDVEDAAAKLRAVWSDPEARQARAEAAFANVQANFSTEAIARRYGARLREILKTRD